MATPPVKRPLDNTYIYGILFVIFCCVVFNILVWHANREPGPTQLPFEEEEPSSPSFAGSSDKLSSTVMLPTLETPLPAGKSVVWVATSSQAWQELHRLAGGDVEIDGMPELSKQLNQSITVAPGMEKEHFYATAGLRSQGIYDTVKEELSSRFPDFAAPTPPDTPLDAILTYACLKMAMK
jgi:hypothetical protein